MAASGSACSSRRVSRNDLACCFLTSRPRILDVDQQLECFSILRTEVDHGAACLAVTHDINLALTFCTRILVLAERTVAHDLAD